MYYQIVDPNKWDEMYYQIVDPNKWDRGPLFTFYIDQMRVVMSLTVEGGKLPMPLTMNIHHAVADGFHLSRFFTEVQALIDSLPAGAGR